MISMSENELAAKLGVTRREISLRAEPSTRLIPQGARVIWISPKRFVFLLESEWPRFNWPEPTQRTPQRTPPPPIETHKPARKRSRAKAKPRVVALVDVEARRQENAALTRAERLAAVEAALERTRAPERSGDEAP